jgi:hypothetical protein
MVEAAWLTPGVVEIESPTSGKTGQKWGTRFLPVFLLGWRAFGWRSPVVETEILRCA